MLEFLGFIFVLFLTSITRGLVLVKLWNWFIIPTFSNAPKLTVPVALGIGLLLSYISGNLSSKNNNETDDVKKQITNSFAKAILYALFALLLGWIYTLFM